MSPDPSTVLDGRLLAMWQHLTFDAGMRGADPPAGYGWQQGLAPALPDGSYVVVPQTMFQASSGDDGVWVNNALTQSAQNTGTFNGGKVRLLPVNYSVQSQITMPSNSQLIGSMPVQADSSSNYGAGSLALQGTVLTAGGPFTQPSPPAAVIACTNTTGTQQGGQVIANLSIEANTTPAGSGVSCILLHGAVGAGVIDNVVLHRSDGACLRFQTDTGTGKVPDQWRINQVVAAASRSSHGILADNIPDSIFTNCLSHNNALDGWLMNGVVNTHFLGCRGENNTNNGFHFGGQVSAGEDCWLTGCSTQLNVTNGYLFDATAHTGAGCYQLTGCRSNTDGTGGGTTAGYMANGCKSVVMVSGSTALTGGIGAATGAPFGAYYAATAAGLAVVGCRLQGTTAATGNDGTGVVNIQTPIPF